MAATPTPRRMATHGSGIVQAWARQAGNVPAAAGLRRIAEGWRTAPIRSIRTLRSCRAPRRGGRGNPEMVAPGAHAGKPEWRGRPGHSRPIAGGRGPGPLRRRAELATTVDHIPPCDAVALWPARGSIQTATGRSRHRSDNPAAGVCGQRAAAWTGTACAQPVQRATQCVPVVAARGEGRHTSVTRCSAHRVTQPRPRACQRFPASQFRQLPLAWSHGRRDVGACTQEREPSTWH